MLEEISNIAEGLVVGIREGRERGLRGRVFQSVNNILEAGDNGVGGRTVGHFNFGGAPRDGVTDADGAGFPNPNLPASVGIEGGADMPTIQTMWGPGGSFVGFVVREDAAAGGAKGRTIELERTVELGAGGDVGVDARGAQKVERDLGLG